MIGFLKQMVAGTKPKVSRPQVLQARPARNPLVEWERARRLEDGPALVLLRVPRRADRWGNLVARVFKLPSHRKIELDEMGSDVWEMCDATLTVDAVTRAVCTKYRLNRRQGEASVTAYLRMLAERRLLALRTGKPAGAASPTQSSKQREKTNHERKSRPASGR